MSPAIPVLMSALAILLSSSADASASMRRSLFPLTRCGPDLQSLCPIHGFFDQVPFRYSLAIYPGCIKWAKIVTPHGVRRQRIVVCG